MLEMMLGADFPRKLGVKDGHQLAGVGRADAVAALDDTQPIVFHWLAVVAMNATLFAQSR